MLTTESETKLTARDVLCDDPASLPVAIERSLIENEMLESLPAHVRGATATASRFVVTQAARAIDGVLGALALDDVLLGGWLQLEDLDAAIQETKADGSSRHVALSSHTIASDHEPSLELMVNETPVRLLDLALTLGFTLDACELVVTGGKVVGVETGSVSAHGELRGAGKSLIKRETKALDPKRIFNERNVMPAEIAAS